MYKTLGLMLAFCLFACEKADAIERAASACENGECVVFVHDKPPAAGALCDSAAVTIRWTVGENVFLTTCEDAGTAEQNTNFLSDAAGDYTTKLVYGRPVLKQFVRRNPGGPVPDKFAPRPYCTPPSLRQVATSAFVLLDKRPANTENGYCFEPTYVHYDKGKVTIDTAKTRIAMSNNDYYGAPLTAQQQSNLAALIHQYGSLPNRPDDSNSRGLRQEDNHWIAAERAYLHGDPGNIGKKIAYAGANELVACPAVSPVAGAYSAERIYRGSIVLVEKDGMDQTITLSIYRPSSNECEKAKFAKYLIEGGAPNIDSLFFMNLDGRPNIFTIVRWDVNSPGADVFGEYYRVYAYAADERGRLIENRSVVDNGAMSGMDGYQEGHESSFPYKTAGAVKSFFKCHEAKCK